MAHQPALFAELDSMRRRPKTEFGIGHIIQMNEKIAQAVPQNQNGI